MDIFPADAAAVALAGAIAGDAVADALEATELFGVEMDHLARFLAFVAVHRRGRFEIAHAAEAEALQHIPVKYARDQETGIMALTKLEAPEELDINDPNLEATGAVPCAGNPLSVYGFAEDAGRGKKAESDAHRRFEIRKTRRGMSFVRAGREIETVDVFPKSLKDEAKGLGHWPLLQSYAYHWGVEVLFDPHLDEIFGITNDKQTVRPIQDLWRILAAEGIDEAWVASRRGNARFARTKTRLGNARRRRRAPRPHRRKAQLHARIASAGNDPRLPIAPKARRAKRSTAKLDDARRSIRLRSIKLVGRSKRRPSGNRTSSISTTSPAAPSTSPNGSTVHAWPFSSTGSILYSRRSTVPS